MTHTGDMALLGEGTGIDKASVPATPAPPVRLATGMAVAVVVVYVAFVGVLMTMRGDQHWDRLVYLLGGFEAIVFSAVGWVFGTTVARGALNDAKASKAEARQQEEEARREARSARQTADETRRDAERGRAMSEVIKAKKGAGTGSRAGARPEAASGSTGSDLAELVQLAERLFPD